jgi:hypothetical protein
MLSQGLINIKISVLNMHLFAVNDGFFEHSNSFRNTFKLTFKLMKPFLLNKHNV